MTLLGGAVEQHHHIAAIETAGVDVDAVPRAVVAEFPPCDCLIVSPPGEESPGVGECLLLCRRESLSSQDVGAVARPSSGEVLSQSTIPLTLVCCYQDLSAVVELRDAACRKEEGECLTVAAEVGCIGAVLAEAGGVVIVKESEQPIPILVDEVG